MNMTSLPANAHIHLPPNFSAFESVEQAVGLAFVQGLGVLGASNYYDYTIYDEFARRARDQHVYPLFGIEIIALLDDLQRAGIKLNDPGNPGKMYICGKGITRYSPMSDEAAGLLETIRKKDSARMAAIIARLAALFNAAGLDTGLDEAAIKDGIVQRHGSPPETVYLQERHIAQAFQESVFRLVSVGNRAETLTKLFGAASKAAPVDPVGIQNEIRSHLMKSGKPAYVEETFVDFDHAYRLILALGGIPCYPVLADGANPICPFEDPVDNLIKEIKSRGIHCAEFIPIRNSPEVLTRYVTAMRNAGLAITAGTEHNTLDLLPMEPACVDAEPIPDQVKEIFWEGACVAAGHQERCLQGQSGFVDAQGLPNSEFEDFDARITAFREIGEVTIKRANARNMD
jgi:hypothetical protein